MWYLLEDFMEQNLVMKGLILLGWLAIAIMGSSFVYTIYSMQTAA